MSGQMDSYTLAIPISLLPSRDRDDSPKSGNVQAIEESFTQSTPTAIVSWGLQAVSTSELKSTAPGARGVAVGCKDGSVFVLRSTAGASPPNISVSIPPNESLPGPVTSPTSPRRHRGLGHPSSRSASPSSIKSALSPFQVTRSRVVSGVSTESAEAPKNYVDFDDEPERLKGMLKGRGGRERHSSTSRSRPEKESIASALAASSGSNLRKDDTRSYLSAALSPSSSTLSLSNPPSPTLVPAASPETSGASSLKLDCHICLSHTGPQSAVSAIKVHEAGRYISCLAESGCLSVHATADGACIVSTIIEPRPKPNPGGKAQPTASMLWVWRSLLVAASEESIILFACASPDEFYPANQFSDAGAADTEYQSLIVAYELSLGSDTAVCEAALSYLGQWTVNGPLNSIGLRAEHDHSLVLFYSNHTGRLVTRSLRVNDPPPSPSDLPESSSSNHLPLPNPFKALKALSTENVQETATDVVPERVDIGAQVEHEEIGLTEPVRGLRTHDGDADVMLCAWSAHELLVSKWCNGTLEKLPVLALSDLQDVRWIDHQSFSALFPDRVAVYSLTHSTAPAEGGTSQCLRQTIPLSSYDVAALTQGGHLVSTRVKNGRRRIHWASADQSDSVFAKATARALWKARTDAFAPVPAPRVSRILPLELDLVVFGYTDGSLSRSSFKDAIRNARGISSDLSLPGAILALDVVPNYRTGEHFLIGGADDGTIAIWSLETLKLCARWTLFTTPLSRIISLHDEKVGRLHGCVLCVSQDGTIAVVALDGYQFIYLVPASAAPLKTICLGEDNLLLLYTDGRTRLWDARTREFWRSMSSEKAIELVQQGGWFEWYSLLPILGTSDRPREALSSTQYASADAASTVLLDIPILLKQLSGSPALTGMTAATTDPKAKLEHARAILAVLLTFGISEGVDTICLEDLGIQPAAITLGVASPDTLSIVPQPTPRSVWTLSPEASADRALAILSLLHFLSTFEDLTQDASTIITFYAASIGQLVADYQPPSLPRLAHHLLRTQIAEMRHAVRLLLETGVARLSDAETNQIVEAWQRFLPSTKPERERNEARFAEALCICGFIAVDKYSLLPTSVLIDIAKSIAVYLHDETSPYRSLAIDLCSRGFQIWQQYVDAVEMLRALFTLATTSKKEAISVPNIGVQARSAVLQIAAGNTPLFMTTLVLDILHPRSVQHRKSVMQLVIFLIRKKPLVLYSNLPRLVEAIVKSLDPNSSASRDAVLDSATEILSHIVQTFPTVDFHMGSQRLAVGTSEGAVVMYDLKTATRLYVLEGHKKRTTACSFSPDGRRLVTLSLEESDVLVWKVGSSFTSFFMPGAPPRQGHSGSEPYKTLNFHIGESAHMSIEDTLVNVQFEWTGDRNVKLKIRDTTLTFST
ncbi:WD40 repeat-like protein [Trametes coccinea BRFM310]|uniref:WD40 repeat-like protein n=1 Tax=Trametes coccinea (strain BRFM310) TaxID=1353009 RepID=A0A1Y2IA39_TRAC3|nr:WD40 repeat-like protein [Trametes coccinea BRFM310]